MSKRWGSRLKTVKFSSQKLILKCNIVWYTVLRDPELQVIFIKKRKRKSNKVDKFLIKENKATGRIINMASEKGKYEPQ